MRSTQRLSLAQRYVKGLSRSLYAHRSDVCSVPLNIRSCTYAVVVVVVVCCLRCFLEYAVNISYNVFGSFCIFQLSRLLDEMAVPLTYIALAVANVTDVLVRVPRAWQHGIIP